MLSSILTKGLIKASIIKEEDYELYEYSIQSLIGNVLNILSSLIIGLLLNEFAKAVLFLAIMVPLRSMIGGCHAKSKIICYLLSCGIVCVCLLLPTYLGFISVSICGMACALLLMLIVLIAPVDCIEKPMSLKEKNMMHARIVWLAVIVGVIFLVLCGLKLKEFCIEILLMLLYGMSTLVIEIIRKRRMEDYRSCSKNDHS